MQSTTKKKYEASINLFVYFCNRSVASIEMGAIRFDRLAFRHVGIGLIEHLILSRFERCCLLQARVKLVRCIHVTRRLVEHVWIGQSGLEIQIVVGVRLLSIFFFLARLGRPMQLIIGVHGLLPVLMIFIRVEIGKYLCF